MDMYRVWIEDSNGKFVDMVIDMVDLPDAFTIRLNLTAFFCQNSLKFNAKLGKMEEEIPS